MQEHNLERKVLYNILYNIFDLVTFQLFKKFFLILYYFLKQIVQIL